MAAWILAIIIIYHFLPQKEMASSSPKFDRIFILPAFMKLIQYSNNNDSYDFYVICTKLCARCQILGIQILQLLPTYSTDAETDSERLGLIQVTQLLSDNPSRPDFLLNISRAHPSLSFCLYHSASDPFISLPKAALASQLAFKDLFLSPFNLFSLCEDLPLELGGRFRGVHFVIVLYLTYMLSNFRVYMMLNKNVLKDLLLYLKQQAHCIAYNMSSKGIC